MQVLAAIPTAVGFSCFDFLRSRSVCPREEHHPAVAQRGYAEAPNQLTILDVTKSRSMYQGGREIAGKCKDRATHWAK